jgi:TPR repeat protein
MIHRAIVACALAISGCTPVSHSEMLAIPVIDKSEIWATLANDIADSHKNNESANTQSAEAVAVFVPSQSQPIQQSVTFITSGHELAKPIATISKPSQPVGPVDIDKKIAHLTQKYAEGDAESAYQLVSLLLKKRRVEEAETVLDYAARQKHIPAMLLYARYYQKMGDKSMAKNWFQAAAGEGSAQAREELKSL